MKLSTSREECLEVICTLKGNKGTVHSINITQHMGISRPSICIVVKQLGEQGYIKKDPAGLIRLTDSGKTEIKLVLEVCCFFKQVLIDADISHEQAHINARRPRHAIGEESFGALKKAGLLHELKQDK